VQHQKSVHERQEHERQTTRAQTAKQRERQQHEQPQQLEIGKPQSKQSKPQAKRPPPSQATANDQTMPPTMTPTPMNEEEVEAATAATTTTMVPTITTEEDANGANDANSTANDASTTAGFVLNVEANKRKADRQKAISNAKYTPLPASASTPHGKTTGSTLVTPRTKPGTKTGPGS